MAISTRDLRQAFRFLNEIPDLVDDETPFSSGVLQELGRLIPADMVEYFEIRQRDRWGLAYTTSRAPEDPPEAVHAFERFRHQNPIGAFRWGPADGALRLSTVISRPGLERLEFYQGYLRPARIRDQLKIWLRRTSESAVCISLDRSDGVFSDRDAAILQVLQPQLAARHAARRAARGTEVQVARTDSTLTTREAQVLVCAAAGRSTREIAALLFVSPGTVRKHLEHAYAKLGVRSRSEAAALLQRAGPPPRRA